MRLLHTYAHTMDSGDEAAWVDVFTEDAVFDTVEKVGGRVVHHTSGRAELAEYIGYYPKAPDYCKHVIVNPLITLDEDATGASVKAYWLFLQRSAEGGAPVVTAFGTYQDRLAKVDGEWKIAERYAGVEATNAP